MSVENISTGNFVSSSTVLINDFEFSDDFDGINSLGAPNKFSFYNITPNQPENTAGRLFSWKPQDNPNADIYQLGLRFYFKEDGVLKNILWLQPEVNEDLATQSFSGVDFFSFLNRELDKNNSVREFVSISIEMTLGTKDLATYMAVNDEITGIVQQRPNFTNIENGIGIFSSRYTRVIDGIQLVEETRNALINTDILDRNFQ